MTNIEISRRVSLACALTLTLSASVSCHKCDDNARFLDALREAVLYPETFESGYRQQHKGDFNNDFVQCGTDCVSALREFIQQSRNSCYETFVDPDFINGCLGDLDPWLVIQGYAEGLRDIIKNGTPYNSTVMYSVATLAKRTQRDWVSLMGAELNVAAPLLSCRRCRFSIFGL